MSRFVRSVGRGLENAFRAVRDAVMPSYKLMKEMSKSNSGDNSFSPTAASAELATPTTSDVNENITPVSSDITDINDTGGTENDVTTPITDIPAVDRIDDPSTGGLGEIAVDLPTTIPNPLETEEDDFLRV